jgi:predicted peptidase
VPGTRWDTPGQITAAVKLLDEISNKYRVDKDRVYATGLSMGGKGTWLIGHEAPDRFAAIAPISAVAVEPDKAVAHFSKMSLWIICGANDGGFTEGSKQMADVLKKGNCDVELMVFPNEGHGVWARYYPDVKFYEWLLKHKRK